MYAVTLYTLYTLYSQYGQECRAVRGFCHLKQIYLPFTTGFDMVTIVVSKTFFFFPANTISATLALVRYPGSTALVSIFFIL